MDINEVVQKTAEEAVNRVAEPIIRSAIASALRGVTAALEREGFVPHVDSPVVAESIPCVRLAAAVRPAAPVSKKHRRKHKVARPVGDTMSVAQAAEAADVTPKTVYNAIEDGKLKATRVPAPKDQRRGAKGGKVTVVTLAALNAWRKVTN